MKKRITKFLLLSLMMVCFIMPFITNKDKIIVSNSILFLESNITGPNKADVIINPVLNDMYSKFNNSIEFQIEKMELEMELINSISDIKDWFIAYKNIIEKYSALDLPETIYDYFSEEELDLLFHVVQAEVGDENLFEQKVNVVSVIFNRLNHSKFEDTLFDVLLAENQFQPILDGRYKEVEVSEDTILACEYAFMIENTAQECLFFDSNSKLDYEYVFNDGIHNFYKYKE